MRLLRIFRLSKRRAHVVFTMLALLVSGTLLLTFSDHLSASAIVAMVMGSRGRSSLVCHDVLRNMLVGRWDQREMTKNEKKKMKQFHRKVRHEEHKIPRGIERKDKKCGNVTVGSYVRLQHFRGLCNAEGDTPCCYENECVNKAMADCTCANCFDMRRPVHAEYATWRPADPSCQPRKWKSEEACALLKNWTIHFIGDSLVRHVYTAFLLEIRGNARSGAFKPHMTGELRRRCAGLYMFTEKVCRLWLDTNTTACQGTVQLQFVHAPLVSHGSTFQQAVLNLSNKPRSFAFLGIGFHDDLNTAKVWDVLGPLMEKQESENWMWPVFLWAGVHKFGMMRTPLTNVNNDEVLRFNRDMDSLLAPYGVPVFDTYRLVDNMMSFDGQHYGYGVNRVKASILLHYFEELMSQRKR